MTQIEAIDKLNEIDNPKAKEAVFIMLQIARDNADCEDQAEIIDTLIDCL
jgi:hypothetical protein